MAFAIKTFFDKLIEDSKNCKSGEEQFELHKKYYKYIGDVSTFENSDMPF